MARQSVTLSSGSACYFHTFIFSPENSLLKLIFPLRILPISKTSILLIFLRIVIFLIQDFSIEKQMKDLEL